MNPNEPMNTTSTVRPPMAAGGAVPPGSPPPYGQPSFYGQGPVGAPPPYGPGPGPYPPANPYPGAPMSGQPGYGQPPVYGNPFNLAEIERKQKKRALRQAVNRSNWAVFLGIVAMNLLFLLLLYLLPLLGYRYTGFEQGFGGVSPVMYYLIQCVAYIVGIGLPFVLVLKHCGVPEHDVLHFAHVSPGVAVCCVLFGLGACMASNYPANVVIQILDSMGVNSSLDSSVPYTSNVAANILYVIGVAVIPPLVEELGFRGVMLSALRRYGDGFAVLVTAVAFGIFHGNPIQIPFAFCVGLVLGYIMVRTNNLLLCVVIHALNNGISVFFELISPYVSDGMYNLLNVTIAYGLILVGGICAVILLTRYKKQFGSRKTVVMSPWGPQVLRPRPPVELSLGDRWGAVWSNPGFLSLVVLSLLECALFMYG